MIGRALVAVDDFAIDNVAQPTVFALGLPARSVSRFCYCVGVALLFGATAYAWIVQGWIASAAILSIFLVTFGITKRQQYPRDFMLGRLARLTWIVAFGSTVAIGVLNPSIGFNVMLVLELGVDVACLAAEYFAVCADPPPKGKIAWSLGA